MKDKLDIKIENDVEDGLDGLYCAVCFDGSKPNWENQDHISGVFRLSKTETEAGGGGLQTRRFLNLKGSIRGDI